MCLQIEVTARKHVIKYLKSNQNPQTFQTDCRTELTSVRDRRWKKEKHSVNNERTNIQPEILRRVKTPGLFLNDLT